MTAAFAPLREAGCGPRHSQRPKEQSRAMTPKKCIECHSNYADQPSKLCPGCEAYQAHKR